MCLCARLKNNNDNNHLLYKWRHSHSNLAKNDLSLLLFEPALRHLWLPPLCPISSSTPKSLSRRHLLVFLGLLPSGNPSSRRSLLIYIPRAASSLSSWPILSAIQRGTTSSSSMTMAKRQVRAFLVHVTNSDRTPYHLVDEDTWKVWVKREGRTCEPLSPRYFAMET